MKVTLSFEQSISTDVAIMVDALRASTTITLALDNFEKIIPCTTPEEAFKLKNKYDALLAGERNGRKIDGFDIGNTPTLIKDLKTSHDTLIFTSTNGTRILKNMTSKVLVGCMINAKAVALKSIKLAESHIDVVMAGVKGEFAIEDFLASGEILYQISKNLKNCKLDEYAKASIMASRDYDALKKAFMSSKSAKRLIELNYKSDVELSSLKNISENVAIFKNKELQLYIL